MFYVSLCCLRKSDLNCEIICFVVLMAPFDVMFYETPCDKDFFFTSPAVWGGGGRGEL